MASTYVDEFVLNFDLNHLPSEANVQTLEQKYERLRKSTSWLKSKIISTDFAIQKYLSKTEDYNQAVKAHSATRDDLKQMCINYKDISDKYTIFESEKKTWVANHELLQKKAEDLENKYGALISHTNQLQMLVKQLQTEKEALAVEKQLEKNNDKEVKLLQKEKDAMLNDIITFKDIILGKKKKCKRHVILLKKYGKIEDSKVYTSEESEDEMEEYCDPLSHSKKNINTIDKDVNTNLLRNTERYFLDHHSDSSNGEISVDTGRGSSRANSHDKELCSPDYSLTPETLLKVPKKYGNKQVDAASSPITVCPPVSVATSPIVFDDSKSILDEAPLIEDQYDVGIDYSECLDSTEYTVHDIPISDDMSLIQEKHFVDACTNPASISFDYRKSIEKETSAIDNVTDVVFKEPVQLNVADKASITVGKQKSSCLKTGIFVSKDKVFVNVSTSPIPNSIDHRKFVETGTNTSYYAETRNMENATLIQFCDKSTCTDPVTLTEKKCVEASTSPIFSCESLVSSDHVKSNQRPTIDVEEISRYSNQKNISKSGNSINQTRQIQDRKSQVKLCLENNSSKNLCYEKTNDDEVQSILNVMKLHHEIVSPIPRTPCDCEQQKHLVNELDYKLSTLCGAIAEVYRMADQFKNPNTYTSRPMQLHEQSPLSDTGTRNSNFEQQRIPSMTSDIVEIGSVSTTSISVIETDTTCTDNVNFKKPKIPMHDVSKAKKGTSSSRADEKENNQQRNSQSEHSTSDSELSEVFENDLIILNNTDRIGASILPDHCTVTPSTFSTSLNVTKRRKISKLQKLRTKLLSNSKIKKSTPFVTKPSLKARKIIQKDISSPSLNKKIAYEKAVKVMAELRLNRELQEKKVKSTTNQQTLSGKIQGKIESSPKGEKYECKMGITRNRTRSVCKKEDEIILSPAKSILFERYPGEVEKIPLKRKTRKRPADSEVHSSQSNTCKRILRSSSIIQVTNNKELPVTCIEDVETLHKDNRAKQNICERNLENITLVIAEKSSNSNPKNDTDHSHQMDTPNVCKNPEEKNSSTKINRDECLLTTDKNKKVRKISIQDELNSSSNMKQNVARSLNMESIKEASNIGSKNPVVEITPLKSDIINNHINNVVCYSDLDLYVNEPCVKDKVQDERLNVSQHRKENILCATLDRYGVMSVKYVARKVPDSITLTICQKVEECIADIIASPKDHQKSKMDDLISSVQNFKTKYILSGLMKYLKDPTRKAELFNKINNGAAPPMTKPEMILLYVIEHLNGLLPSGDFISRLWNNMEHALFQLNRTPDFDVIESMSHFYAVMCRYFRNKSRLRCFMLDAMYCLQFKAVPLIRQCLDVCPGVLPFAHEHMAKTSLVTCLVYLLHFYKCQDKFNRAQDIRNILYRKYSYRFSEWNETMILEIFRKAIMDLRGTHNDKKMLRVALIILCKRHGAKWCETNIIQNILLPIIENQDVPERIKQFCVLMLGPLLKPFPADRKAQCEIVINQLLQMLRQNPSHEMKESIYSSLIFMNKHDQQRVVQALLSWNPENISPEFEEILNDYVMEKPLTVWKKLVTMEPSPCS